MPLLLAHTARQTILVVGGWGYLSVWYSSLPSTRRV